MPHGSHPAPGRPQRWWRRVAGQSLRALLILVWLAAGPGAATGAAALTVTNLQQLAQAVGATRRVVCDVRLEATVCAASRAEVGAVIVQDDTGVELLELGDFAPPLQPGDHIQLAGEHCLVRQRETGLEISAAPVVDDDGAHPMKEADGAVTLTAGYHPLRLDWFNSVAAYGLELYCTGPQIPRHRVPASDFWHDPTNAPGGALVYAPGLQVAARLGYWDAVPDFNLLPVVAAGFVPDLDLGFCPQIEYVGLRFTGFFRAPRDGTYQFELRSDDGALLFIDPQTPVVRVLRQADPPVPAGALAGQEMPDPGRGSWVSVEGRISFVSAAGVGLRFELLTGTGRLQVRVADARGWDPARLLQARIRARGLGRGVGTLDGKQVLGRLMVAGTNDLQILEAPPATGSTPARLTAAEQVQRLSREEAERQLPVRIRGVVTSSAPRSYGMLTVQDDTRGIFVRISAISNNIVPVFGELWEVAGHTMPGDFAPIIYAEELKPMGPGQLPEPVRPTWEQLVNGSLDVQWAEIQGGVTMVFSNQLTLVLPEGRLQVQLDRQYETALRPFLNCHVRIRGTLYAVWDRESHEVRPGQIRMLNATITIDDPVPQDAFDAPLKTARELLHFDVQEANFRRVKVQGQVIYADPRQLYLMDGKAGLRVLPAEMPGLQAGDLVEAAGYPEISGLSPVLREAAIRKTGAVALPVAPSVAEADLFQATNDATRVRLTGEFLGWHTEAGLMVLEMKAGRALFAARLANGGGDRSAWRPGSRLALTGVCVGQIRSGPTGPEMESFELLLNSPADVRVLTRPSWWTLPRLLGLVAVLLMILALAFVWITQLHRQVEQRTRLLQREIAGREIAERQRALEAERSRIARDLHDDLGSSLTEIGALASSGVRTLPPAEDKSAGLFRAISNQTRSLIGALDVIVWAVDPEENSLQSLADYLSGYAREYLEHSGVACRFRIPMALPEVTLVGRVRHDLFLAIKEALHNVVQHSEATEVEFHLAVTEAGLEIVVADNGRGFEPQPGGGHGLKNLPARLAQMGGGCEVISSPGRGTQVNIRLPLPPAAGLRGS